MKVAHYLILLSILGFSFDLRAKPAVKCILPNADDREGSSPPQLVGHITNVSIQGGIGRITVKPSQKDAKPKTIEISLAKTGSWTVDGGLVNPEEWTAGQKVEIWYKNCRSKSSGVSETVVVQIYSTDPKDPFNK